MTHERSLFSGSPTIACPEYKNVRNAEDENCKRAKEHCEDLWCNFAQHADKHFLDEFQIHFHQRWFEMYLTVSFIRAGFDVMCPKPGPDVLLTLGGRRVWIEAVCTTLGQEELADSVPPTKSGEVEPVPIAEYVKRIRSSLHEKVQKFEKYIEDGIVSRGDLTAVAINIGDIHFLYAYMEDSMKRLLYGIVDPVVTIDTKSRKLVSTDHQTIQTIRKSSGAHIGVQPFVDESMPHISSVLASSADAVGRPPRLGGDYILYPNLICTNCWPRCSIPLGKEWLFEENRNEWVGKKINHIF